MPLDPARTVAELRELRELTGDDDGAQRVAWTPTWASAKDWLGSKLEGLPLEYEVDEAGNQWWTLRGDVRARRADRRPHRLGAERRLARRLPERRCCGRGAAPDRRGGHAAGHRAARRLGRRGGGALRPVALRLLRGRRLDGRPGRAARAEGSRRRRAAGCAAGARRRSRHARSTRARSWRTRPPTWSCTSSRGRCSSRWTCRSARCSARSASSATGSPGAARRRTPARRRWTSAATRSPAPPSSRSSCARSRKRTGDGAVLTSGGVVCKPGIVTSVVETAEQLLDMRHLDAGKLASMWEQVREACERFAAEEKHRGRVRADLADRADPLRRDADRLRRRGDPRGRGHVAPAAERAAARRRRGLARRRADGDALRPEPARPLAHEARGHEAGAPRARRPGARPPGDEDARLGRPSNRCQTRSDTAERL